MNKDVAKNLRYGFILLSICAVCAFFLAAVNNVTSPVIAQHQAEEKAAALQPLAAGAQIGEEKPVEGDAVVTSAYALDGGKSGWILTLTGSGYGGAFQMLASYKPDGTLIGAKMLQDSETPGLGKRAEEDWYMAIFEGTGSDASPVPLDKNSLPKEQKDAVSGATVTYTGVTKALAYGADYVKGGKAQ